MKAPTILMAVVAVASLSAVAASPAAAKTTSIKMAGNCPPPPKGTVKPPSGYTVISCTVKGGPLKKAVFAVNIKLVGSSTVGTCTLKGGGKSLKGKESGSATLDATKGLITMTGKCAVKGGSVKFVSKAKTDGTLSTMSIKGKVK